MSDMSNWSSELFANAERVPVWVRPSQSRFSAAPTDPASRGFSAWVSEPVAPAADMPPHAAMHAAADMAPPSVSPEQAQADAYAQGFNDGNAAAFAAIEGEHAAMDRLATALSGIDAEPAADLARLLSETVSRLVRQVVGEVEMDQALLTERTQAVAALITDENKPARLRLHPHDVARIDGLRPDLALVADPTLAEGSVIAETAAGWIEDGPAIRLDKLRVLLDQMGVRR